MSGTLYGRLLLLTCLLAGSLGAVQAHVRQKWRQLTLRGPLGVR